MATNNDQVEIKNLVTQVKKLRGELDQSYFEASSAKFKNVHKPRALRKQIARALTKIHQLSYKHV